MKLLVAVDGSRHSDEAVRSVDRFSSDSQVILLHVIDPIRFYPTVGFDLPIVYTSEIEKEMRDAGGLVLQRAAALIAPGASRVTQRLEIGFPAEVILSMARKEKVDLVLLGARGLGPIEELVFGSVSHQVLAHAPCQVLVLRGPLPSVKRILVPAETEADADRLLRFLARRPFREAPEIRFVTIAPLGRALSEHVLPDEKEKMHTITEKARSAALRFADRASELGFRATSAALLGTPAEAILEEAEAQRADLILLGSRGRSTVSRFLLGSVGHTVLHRAHHPVLVVRGATDEAKPRARTMGTRKAATLTR